MEVRAVIQIEDWYAYTQFLSERALSRSTRLFLSLLPALIVGITIFFQSLYGLETQDIVDLAAGGVAVGVSIYVSNNLFTQKTRPEVEGFILGPRKLRVAAEGVYEGNKAFKAVYFWPTIRNVALTPEHLFLVMDRNAAITIPRRAFADEAACEAFQAEIERYRKAAVTES